MEDPARAHVVLIQSHVDCGAETVTKTAIVWLGNIFQETFPNIFFFSRGIFVGRIIASTSTVREYHLPRIAVKSCVMELA